MSLNNQNQSDDRFSSRWVNLADESLGAKVLDTTDDFFAEKENLIKPGRGIFIPDKYTENGKWMDGWESRRKRTSGHDFITLRLGLPGVLRGIDIDTNHFLGNHPPEASIEACFCSGDPDENSDWTEVLPRSSLGPGMQNLFQIHSKNPVSHLRLHIFPDGGVARLKVYGEVFVDWSKMDLTKEMDLAGLQNGGKALGCNDMFFSSRDNLIKPGKGINMGDGWETRRRREPGNDWLILALGRKGILRKILVDTAYFKGNFPESCSLDAALIHEADPKLALEEISWQPLLSRVKLGADREHHFESEVISFGPVTHLRLNIFPDGGISRLRCLGTPV
jgi:allantoicase